MSNTKISKIGVEYLRGDVLFSVDGEFLESYEIHTLFSIDDSNITIEMATHSAKYGRIAVLLSRAERYRSYMKQQVEIDYAIADSEIRRKFKENGDKFTENTVRANIIADADYNDILTESESAVSVVYLLKNLLKAMDAKGDMLISMGAHMRAEMAMTGMYIKDTYDKTVVNMKAALKQQKKI